MSGQSSARSFALRGLTFGVVALFLRGACIAGWMQHQAYPSKGLLMAVGVLSAALAIVGVRYSAIAGYLRYSGLRLLIAWAFNVTALAAQSWPAVVVYPYG